MTECEAKTIYGTITARGTWANAAEAAVWILVLTSPQQADVDFESAQLATVSLLGELDPRKIYPALVLHTARGIQKARAPSTVAGWEAEEERQQLEGPDRRRRQLLARSDRAALERLAQAFAAKGNFEAWEHLRRTLEGCGVVFGDHAIMQGSGEGEEPPF